MTEPTEREQELEREAIEDLDLDEATASDISGGAYEGYFPLQGQKQGPIKNP